MCVTPVCPRFSRCRIDWLTMLVILHPVTIRIILVITRRHNTHSIRVPRCAKWGQVLQSHISAYSEVTRRLDGRFYRLPQ